ncbi:fimbrillin family protein [Segatella copri]|uniref:fimbrillin family protein n=1 Tax=Segatella copri TaxID=165179 RepID=UPI0011835BA6|nr:fimbrillin family protein [Segatella copri]
MKKQIMFMAMTAMLIASCSSDDVVSTNTGRAIDFRTSVGTRGAETTTDNITKFWVTAIDEAGANYFSQQEFTKDGEFFTSSPLYYWPAGELKFFAYSPSATDLGGALTISNTTKELKDFSPATEIAEQKDFVTATTSGTRAANETKGVKLTFAHQLSQIEIKAKNTNTGYIYKVVGVRIGKPVSKGTFTFDTNDTNKWTLTTTEKANYAVDYATTPRTLAADAATMMGTANDNAMLLPQQLEPWTPETDKANTNNGAYIALKIQITTKDGARVYPAKGDYDWAAVAIDTNWEAGKKYVYTLDFSNGAGKVDPEKPQPVDPTDPFKPGEDILGKPIKFTVIVTPWAPADQPVEM